METDDMQPGFKDRIIVMSMSNDIDGDEGGNQELFKRILQVLLHTPQGFPKLR